MTNSFWCQSFEDCQGDDDLKWCGDYITTTPAPVAEEKIEEKIPEETFEGDGTESGYYSKPGNAGIKHR